MAATGVLQVKYINRAMANFGKWEVILYHYVCFTFFSIMGNNILYQEFSSDDGLYVHLFIDGSLGQLGGHAPPLLPDFGPFGGPFWA